MGCHFAKARVAARCYDLKWHDPCRAAATMGAQVDAMAVEIQARLGHSTSVAAQLRQHAAKDRDRQLTQKLSSLPEDDLLRIMKVEQE